MAQHPEREEVARLLEKIAELLEVQGANRFRIQSYRNGARTIRQTDKPVLELAEQGDRDDLVTLPNIGEGLSNVIIEFVQTGRSSFFDELRGEVAPVELFNTVPGIGQKLAQRIVDRLDIDTLEELEQAAHDGRLAGIEGFGPGRVKQVRTSLAGILSGAARQHQRRISSAEEGKSTEEPPVSLLLSLDESYRERAAQGDLPTIAPNRFNPDDKAWLPIMNTTRAGWQFTILYSNTARAHELGKTDDWVVIYWQPAAGGPEKQNTVVTETSGPLEGKRVVRGRETETREYYRER
jgi:putative hydrolase